jgi:hypothetical protein
MTIIGESRERCNYRKLSFDISLSLPYKSSFKAARIWRQSINQKEKEVRMVGYRVANVDYWIVMIFPPSRLPSPISSAGTSRYSSIGGNAIGRFTTLFQGANMG